MISASRASAALHRYSNGGIRLLRFPVTSLRNSIFTRMVIIYLIFVIPIILLGIYLYSWSYHNASQEISRAQEAQLASYLDNLEHEIAWLELQMFDIMEDNEIHRAAVTWSLLSNVERKNSLIYVQQRLVSIKNSSSLIKDVYVHMRPADQSVSAVTGIYDYDKGAFDHLSWNSRYQEGKFILMNDALQLAALKQSGRKNEPPLFIVQIELDTEEMLQSMERLNLYSGSGSLLIFDALGFVLASGEGDHQLLQDSLMNMGPEIASPQILMIQGEEYQLNRLASEDLKLSVVSYLPEDELKRPLHRFEQWAWIYACVSLLAVVAYAYISYKKIHQPLLVLVRSFRKMEGGMLDIHIEHNQHDEFGYLYDRFNQMISRLQDLIEQDYKRQMMVQRAELKQLQSQINPHFLYNSFFILHSMAKVGDLERIEEFTLMIGEYFRFITRNGEDFVALEDETRHSRMYTEIQKLRFSRRIKVQFGDLPEGVERVRVPKLIIQPIIENAYEHSLERTEEGCLSVAFHRTGGLLQIIVENSGDISDQEIEQLRKRLNHTPETHEMTGMINIHRRLILAFGEESGLLLSRSDLGGLKVTIQIKLDGRSEDDAPPVDRG